MPDYDFKTLSSYDFEVLVRDLLQEELKVTLESFKTGRDKGIDLRYSTDKKKNLIIQCKHYAETGFQGLLRKLQNDELPKVRRLKPLRYIVATSVALSPQHKDHIITVLAPYCKTSGDILGRDDLNNLLAKFPDIEKQNFKLWLTSQAVLEKILHCDVYNQTDIEVGQIKKELKYYVQNRSFFEAEEILSKLHYCVICGIPGIGKTMLANILLIKHIDVGYEAVKISSNISEGLRLLKPSKPQIFYYDDFLGQTSFEQKFGKNEEQSLLDFVDMVTKTKNKRFVLTTREYILNKAKLVYEKLARSTFDANRCTIELGSYTSFERAKILFNHVHFSDLPKPYKEALLSNKSYFKIIKHRNYNPRIIEWMADLQRSVSISPDSYVCEFMANLDNPSRIWQHAFENQLSESSRHTLMVLASLPTKVFLDDLEYAFNSFHKLAVAKYGLKGHSNDFRQAIKELDGAFLSTNRTKTFDDFGLTVELLNPSVRDFLNKYLLENNTYLQELIESAVFFEQCETLWTDEIKSLIRKKTSEFLKALCRTIHSTSCRLGYFVGGYHNPTYIGRSISFFEERVISVYDILRDLDRGQSQKVADEITATLIDRISNNNGNRDKLLDLTKKLRDDKFQYVTDKIGFARAASSFFNKDLDTIEHYSQLLQYNSLMSLSLRTAEHNKLRRQFAETYPSEVKQLSGDDDESPEYIRNIANKLESVATFFDLDVEGSVQELESWAEEIEDSHSEPDYDSDSDYDGASSQDDSTKAIDRMFETLTD